MTTKHGVSCVAGACLLSALVFAQSTAEPRRLGFDFRPIVAHLQPGDRNVVLRHPQAPPLLAPADENQFLATLVEGNPIIFSGRVSEILPAFLKLRGRQDFTEASVNEANWVGSRITVVIDRIIQTVAELPLLVLQRLAFVDDGEGVAVINGVTVKTETPWLDSILPGRRYLISGRMRDGRFSVTGMWMDPQTGGNMRPRLRDFSTLSKAGEIRSASQSKTPLDRWTIEEASYWLDREVQRRAAARRP